MFVISFPYLTYARMNLCIITYRQSQRVIHLCLLRASEISYYYRNIPVETYQCQLYDGHIWNLIYGDLVVPCLCVGAMSLSPTTISTLLITLENLDSRVETQKTRLYLLSIKRRLMSSSSRLFISLVHSC